MTDCRTNNESRFSADFDDFLAVMGQVSDGVALWGQAPWRIAYSNQAFADLSGIFHDEREGNATPDESVAALRSCMQQVLDHFVSHDKEATATTTVASVERIGPIEIRLFRLRPGDDRLVGMIVSPNTKASPEVGQPAESGHRDPLTGLPDRAFLIEHLSAKLAGERVADRQFAIVFFDLDNFKHVNDALGHLVGDVVLREAAQRIAACLREGDHVVRYGGDEFVALIDGIGDPSDVAPVISRVQIAFAKPFDVANRQVSLSLSAGVAFASPAIGSPEELLAAADRAMYAAKRTAVQSQ